MNEKELLKRIEELEGRATAVEKRNRQVLKDQFRRGIKDLVEELRAGRGGGGGRKRLKDWVQKADPIMTIIKWGLIIWELLQLFLGRKRQPAEAGQA